MFSGMILKQCSGSVRFFSGSGKVQIRNLTLFQLLLTSTPFNLKNVHLVESNLLITKEYGTKNIMISSDNKTVLQKRKDPDQEPSPDS